MASSHGACMCPDCGKPQMTEGLFDRAKAKASLYRKDPGRITEQMANYEWENVKKMVDNAMTRLESPSSKLRNNAKTEITHVLNQFLRYKVNSVK